MSPTDAECAARYRIQPALRERRRSVSTIHQVVRSWKQHVTFMRVEPHQVAAPANVDVDFGPVGQGDVDHRVSARWTRNAAAPLTSHGVQPQWIDRFWREAIAQQLDRSCTTAAVVARPENAARSAYFFQWQFAARANERRVSSHRVRFALTMTNDDCRTNDEIRTRNDSRPSSP